MYILYPNIVFIPGNYTTNKLQQIFISSSIIQDLETNLKCTLGEKMLIYWKVQNYMLIIKYL